MALVQHVKKVEGAVRLHPTVVDAEVKVGALSDHKWVVQIDTRGSKSREIEGKLSQTIQLTDGSAFQLYKILRETFGFEK